MKNCKILLALVLAMTMILGLCACGEKKAAPATTEATAARTQTTTEPAQTTEGTQGTTEGTTEAPVDTTAAAASGYTVKVVDEGGNPIAGVMLQLCDEACYPAQTDANGVATWALEEGNYKASFLKIPEGYEAMDEANEFYFDEGNFEMVLTLKTVA